MAEIKTGGQGGFSAAVEALFQGMDHLVATKKDNAVKLVNIKNQNTVNKMLDMVPDLVNRFTGGKVTVGEPFSADAVKTAEEMAESKGDLA